MRIQKINIIIGSLAMLFFCTALLTSIFKDKLSNPENLKKVWERNILSTYSSLNEVTKNDEVIKLLSDFPDSGQTSDIREFFSAFDLGKGYTINLWKNDDLKYWKNRDFNFQFEIIPRSDTVKILTKDHEYFVKIELAAKSTDNISVVYINSLKNLAPAKNTSQIEVTLPLEDISDVVTKSSQTRYDIVIIFSFLLGYFLVISFIFNLSRTYIIKWGFKTVVPIVISCLVVLRIPSLFYPLHTSSNLIIFKPYFFSPEVKISLADTIINIITLLVFSIFYFRDFKSFSYDSLSKNRKYFFTITGYLIFCCLSMFYCLFIKAIVNNQYIPLDINIIPNLDGNHIILFCAIFLLLIALFGITIRIFLSIRSFDLAWGKKLGLFTISMLISSLFFLIDPVELNIWIWMFSLLITMLLFDLFLDTTLRDFTWISVWLLTLCLFTTVLFFHFYKTKVSSLSQVVLEEKINFPDSVLIKAIEQKHPQFNNNLAAYTALNDIIFEKPIIQKNYDIRIVDSIQSHEPDLISSDNDAFTIYSDYNWPISYYFQNNKVTLKATLKVSSLDYQNNLSSGKQKFYNAGDWTIYKGNKNLMAESLFFPDNLTQFNISDSNNTNFVNGNTLYSSARNGEFTIIGRQKYNDLLLPFSFFSFLFVFALFILAILVGMQSIFKILPSEFNHYLIENLTIRNKIQFSVLSILAVTFAIIGIVSSNFYKRTYKESLRNTVKEYYQQIHKTKLSNSNPFELVRSLPGNFVLYDQSGRLISQNISSNDTPKRMEFNTLAKLRGSDYAPLLDESDHEELILPLTNNQNLSFLVYPEFKKVPSGFYNFLNLLLNAFVFLLLISSALSYSISNSIISPITELGKKLKEFSLGKQNETLKWNQSDELGTLIQAYNEMIGKLEHSAELLAHTEREVAWREMAKQVAHEIKNPLTPMKLSIQHMELRIQEANEEEARQIVKEVSSVLIEQIDNLSRIASEFSSFAKLPKPEYEEILLNDLVASVHDLFQTRTDIKFNLYVPIDELFVKADRTHLVRVLNNLVKNALQAIPSDRKGHIFIRLKEEDQKAIVQIEDNGKGIPDELKEKVFFPNFTTKSSGTGLGLAISKNIIETFGGTISFIPNNPLGTIFTFELPLVENGNIEKS
ncbi:sensor histidine kinase [Membranihabitans maritimus]|uniref:sensor histidine kinase n=1 Tax=Membranihabitans maritimus TaxID=2904244 RepID=UPI001F2ACB1A|nr:ATP-binding protein [Membranihabitans maritimus]